MASRTVGATSRSPPPVPQRAVASAHNDHRHRAGRVRSEHGAVAAIDLVLGVAMIGRDQETTVSGLDGAPDATEARVDALHCANRRIEIAGVPDHVRVGVVGDDQCVTTCFKMCHHRVGHSCGAHLRRCVVRGDPRRRHEQTFLTSKGVLAATIDEIRHVRIFLRLSNVELAQPGGAHLLRERVGNVLAWEGDTGIEISFVLGKRHKIDVAEHP